MKSCRKSLGTHASPPHRADEKNGIRCQIDFNAAKGLPSDYFEGYIEKYDAQNPAAEGETLSAVQGSWVGFVDFDKVR
jgi:hypothetical protein